jgi:nicotinate-nucleotide adenylyltransferase
LRIALFGGTFDPIHDAHIAIAKAAREAFGLGRVLIIPAANPPHKDTRETEEYEHRYRMVELACDGIEWLEPSRLEAGVEKSYSIHTIERLRPTLQAEDELFFLIGADAFAEVRTWFRWLDVIKAVAFIVVSRPGHEFDVPAGAIVHRLETVSLDVSSSAIREQLAHGQRPANLPDHVFEYIRAHCLYDFAVNRVS